jgi:hypothetical protein
LQNTQNGPFTLRSYFEGWVVGSVDDAITSALSLSSCGPLLQDTVLSLLFPSWHCSDTDYMWKLQ